MTQYLPPSFQYSSEVTRALSLKRPVVALESTVITHGLPYPDNLSLARHMEEEVRAHGAVPATIAVLSGLVHVGLNEAQVEQLAAPRSPLEAGLVKVSSRDIAPAIVQGISGGTTVAGTLAIAHQAGLKVFATGGIGGVHRDAPFDVSADLEALRRTPLVVVCAGAKAILDLPATLELLETYGVPVIGYGSDDFPAFYSRSSGLKASARAASPEVVARIAQAHWSLGNPSAVLVCQPPPEEAALPWDEVEKAVSQALKEAREQNVRGQAVTPFLLERVRDLTHGNSLNANIALLLNNARLAAQISRFMAL